MAKIKGIYKGFKFVSQIFVVREEEDEMEIGYPTDVKHVAHMGWEGPSGNGPTLMEFSNAHEFQSSLRTAADPPGPNSASDRSSSPEDPENAVGGKSSSSKSADDATGEEALNIPKKHKRKKITSMSSKSRRSSWTGKSKAKQPDIQSITVAARS